MYPWAQAFLRARSAGFSSSSYFYLVQLTIFLRPFSWLYGLILKLRHRLYDRGLMRSQSGALPTIVVGNLELGGTGKTPLTDHILSTLEGEMDLGLLSRGYGRATSGYRDILPDSKAGEVGDEPLMLSQAHPQVRAAVCEDRILGLQTLQSKYALDLVVLDDAYQHRRLRSGFNILVTPYDRPFWENHLLPEGSLRDIKQRARAAHAVVVSKGPAEISEQERAAVKAKVDWFTASPLFFTHTEYAPMRRLSDDAEMPLPSKELILFTGIADDSRLKEFLSKEHTILHSEKYRDHHAYSPADMGKLKEICATFVGRQVSLVTTAKDAVKLRDEGLRKAWEDMPIFYQPIQVRFLTPGFDEIITGYARANKRDR